MLTRIGLLAALTVVASGLAAVPATATSKAPPVPYGTTWTVDTTNNTLRAFAPEASGAATAVAVVSGADTGLDSPTAVGLDFEGRVFVTNSGNDSITEYAAAADGDAVPLRVIAGPHTGLDDPTSLVISDDPESKYALRGNRHLEYVYVTNAASDTVEAFDATDDGDVLPALSIAGPKTKLDHPVAIALDPFGEPVVVNDPATGTPTITAYESYGNHGPITKISPAAPHRLKDPTAIALTGSDRLWVTDADRESLSEYLYFPGLPHNLQGTIGRSIHGPDTGLTDPTDLTHTADGQLVVTNGTDGSIDTFSPDQRGDAAPTASLAAPSTTAGSTIFGVPPTRPLSFTVHHHGQTAVLRWKPPNTTGGGLEGYYADVLDDRQFGGRGVVKHVDLPTPIVTTQASRASFDKLKPGHTYIAVVEAVNAFGNSASATPVTFTAPMQRR